MALVVDCVRKRRRRTLEAPLFGQEDSLFAVFFPRISGSDVEIEKYDFFCGVRCRCVRKQLLITERRNFLICSFQD